MQICRYKLENNTLNSVLFFLVVFSYFYCKYSRSSVLFNLPVIYYGNQVTRIYMSFTEKISNIFGRVFIQALQILARIYSIIHRIALKYTIEIAVISNTSFYQGRR